jgi:hypothetical protein
VAGALAALAGASDHVARAATNTATAAATGAGEEAPDDGWLVDGGAVRVHVRRVLLVDSRRSVAGGCSDGIADVVVASDDVVRCAIVHWAEALPKGLLHIVEEMPSVRAAVASALPSEGRDNEDSPGDGPLMRFVDGIGFLIRRLVLGSRAEARSQRSQRPTSAASDPSPEPSPPSASSSSGSSSAARVAWRGTVAVETDSATFFALCASALAPRGFKVVAAPPTNEQRAQFHTATDDGAAECWPVLVHYARDDARTAQRAAACASDATSSDGHSPRVCAVTASLPALPSFPAPPHGGGGGATSGVAAVCVGVLQEEALCFVRELLQAGVPPSHVQRDIDAATASVLATTVVATGADLGACPGIKASLIEAHAPLRAVVAADAAWRVVGGPRLGPRFGHGFGHGLGHGRGAAVLATAPRSLQPRF